MTKPFSTMLIMYARTLNFLGMPKAAGEIRVLIRENVIEGVVKYNMKISLSKYNEFQDWF